MKNFIVFFALLIFVGCNKDESPIEHQKSPINSNEILGTWFRTTPIKFGALHGNPAFERGENHIEVKFLTNGEFEHRYTTLGFYENQNPTDSTSITIIKGTFSFEDDFLSIIRNSRTYIQIYDGDNINRDTTSREYTIQHDYQWPNVQISPDDLLNFTYHTITDIVSQDQISPGIELREELYERK